LLTMSFIPNQLAIVEHVHQSKLPMLLTGDIDPAVMHTFKLGCLDFFDCKEIKAGDQFEKSSGVSGIPRSMTGSVVTATDF